MTWYEAYELLTANIRVRQDLDPVNGFKIVVAVPPYRCRNFGNEVGYKVQVGQANFVNVPISMLEVLFEASSANYGTYNNSVFAEHYQQRLINKPCYVHTVGKLFSNAGVMEIVNANNYQILDEV